MAAKIRIKDIAQRAGVSAGTVDRVLHNRPSVSKASFEKVKKVMEEMNYTPNMYASALACNRSYTFCVIMPKHSSEAYWDEIEEGTMAACKHLSDFNVDVKIMYYERLNTQSFNNAITECLSYEPQGVILIPADTSTTKPFADTLHKNNIPFVLLDSYIPSLNALSFYGQDSFCCKDAYADSQRRQRDNDNETHEGRQGCEQTAGQPRKRFQTIYGRKLSDYCN